MRHVITCCGPCGAPLGFAELPDDHPDVAGALFGHLCEDCAAAYRHATQTHDHPAGQPPAAHHLTGDCCTSNPLPAKENTP